MVLNWTFVNYVWSKGCLSDGQGSMRIVHTLWTCNVPGWRLAYPRTPWSTFAIGFYLQLDTALSVFTFIKHLYVNTESLNPATSLRLTDKLWRIIFDTWYIRFAMARIWNRLSCSHASLDARSFVVLNWSAADLTHQLINQ